MFSRLYILLKALMQWVFKTLKPRTHWSNMQWFLYGGILLVAFGAWMLFVGSAADLADPTRFHEHKDLDVIMETLKDRPKTLKFIEFVKVRGADDFPGKVVVDSMGDRDQNYWSEIAGNEEYKRISDTADRNNVAIKNVIIEPASKSSLFWPLFMSFGPIVMILALGSFFMNRFGKGGLPGSKNTKITLTRLDQAGEKVTFADVAGIDDELKTLEELVVDLKHPQMLERLGGQVPRGVLLTGFPGTGKTLLVKAIAGETGFAVLAGAGSDFVEQYVGVGAGRVRDAFNQARKLRDELKSWVILFIDELGTVGKDRGATAGPGGAEHQQTVEALLVELNGAGEDNSRILFIAASNQPDDLDAAILRAGRLGDLKIEIGKPDKQGRVAILKINLKKVPAADDVDVDRLAGEMSGMTGADINTLVRKRAPARARRRLFAAVSPEALLKPEGFDVDKHFQPEDFKVTMDDLWLSLMEMVLGNISETKGRRLDPQVKKMIAYHETGHLTLAMRKLLQNTGEWDGQYGDDITDISLLGPNGVGGFVRTTPQHDFQTAKYLKSRLAVAHAGNASERLFLGDATGGCSNDLEQSNRIVKAMLLQLNMSMYHNSYDGNGQKLSLPAISVEQQGGSRFLGGQRSHAAQYGMSDGSAHQVDQLLGIFLREAEAEAFAYLEEERGWVEFFVPRVLEKERMRFPEIKRLWDEFHGDKDLSKSFAFEYNWDKNHQSAKTPARLA